MHQRSSVLACCIAIALCSGVSGVAEAAPQALAASTAIPSMPLKQALTEFAQREHLQLVYVSQIAEGVRTHGAPPGLSREATLQRLLRGTGLQFRFLNADTVTIYAGDGPTPTDTQPQARSRPDQPESSPRQLEKITVTGSRLPAATTEGPQEVQIYSNADIVRSGQQTVADFLNNLPQVSTVVDESGNLTYGGAQTVRLRGLPVGSTLVLLDGRTVGGSSPNQYHGNPFNLNFIPISAVERIEVVPEAASAVYGSDAIGGVVNVMLRKNLDGGEFNISSGRPTQGGFSDTTASLAWGKNFSRGNLTVVGSYQNRSELSAAERDLTANQDYRRFGGPDSRVTTCEPGNVYSVDGSNLPGLTSSFAGVPTSSSGPLTPSDFLATEGQLNKCSAQATGSVLVPETQRGNLLINGHLDLTDATQAFMQVMGSRVEQYMSFTAAGASRTPVPASNPFNPFGVPVLVDYRFVSHGPRTNGTGTDYFSRILGGFRGRWADRWDWEIAAWQTYDHTHLHETVLDYGALFGALANPDPAQSVNLFSSGNPASDTLLSSILVEWPISQASKLQTVNAFVRGTLIDLPTGPLDVVFGGEYNHETQNSFAPGEGQAAPELFSRSIRSLFAEARVPLWGAKGQSLMSDRLALTVAGRYDRYSDFGSKFTPEAGLELRPSDTLLLRASYGKSFKAPDLTNVYSPPSYLPGIDLPPDPLRGGELGIATIEFGGNPDIRPQTGNSRTVGVVWSSKAIPNLQVSLTNFRVTQDDRIVQPNIFFGFDTIPANLIVRAAPTPDDIAKGYAGKVLMVDMRYVNFGALLVEGNDLDIRYRFDTSIGTFSPSLSATGYYKYQSATFGALEDRLGYASEDAFAPRWKGTLALDWTRGAWSARVAGRYLGSYLDYDGARTLGDYWMFDASAHYDFGRLFGTDNSLLSNAFAALSVVNLFDRRPQFSNYYGSGYDPREADIRGRFVSFTLGTRW
jgi:iron complex outermembrane receptor protein